MQPLTVARRRVRIRLHLLRRNFLRAWQRIRHKEHKRVGKAAVASHLVYYGLVAVEAHGMYGKAALVCGVILLVEVVIGGSNED